MENSQCRHRNQAENICNIWYRLCSKSTRLCTERSTTVSCSKCILPLRFHTSCKRFLQSKSTLIHTANTLSHFCSTGTLEDCWNKTCTCWCWCRESTSSRMRDKQMMSCKYDSLECWRHISCSWEWQWGPRSTCQDRQCRLKNHCKCNSL
jgi:hypothetical protein